MDLQSQFNDLRKKQQNGTLQQLSPLNPNQSSSKGGSDLDDLNDLLNLTDEAHFDSGMLQSDAFKIRSLTPKVEKIPRFPSSKLSEQKQQHIAPESKHSINPSQGNLTFWEQEKSESAVEGFSDIQSNDFMSQFSFEVDSVASLSKDSAASFTANFGMAVAESMLQAVRKPKKAASKSVEPVIDQVLKEPSKKSKKSSKHLPELAAQVRSKQVKKLKPQRTESTDKKPQKRHSEQTRVFAHSDRYIWEDIIAARKMIREESQSCIEDNKRLTRKELKKRGLETLISEQTYMLVKISNREKRHVLYPELPSRVIQPLFLRPFLGEGYHKADEYEPGVLSLIILGDGFHDRALIMLEREGVNLSITAYHKPPCFTF